MVEDRVIEQFVEAIRQSAPDNSNNTFEATVSRIDEQGKAWVRIAGAETETPTVSTASEVNKNDHVTVQWRNNKLYILGNTSNPAAGSIRVEAVEQATNAARMAAQSAAKDAGVAAEAAADAKATADSVREIAAGAQESADAAQASAEAAQTDAVRANSAATGALNGLATVEDVVGTLNWITEHSKVTTDTTPEAGKSYYIKNQDNTFTLVTDVEGKNPAQEGWYELNEAVQNYIMSHLALVDGEGLYVMADGSEWKLLVSNDRIDLIDEFGKVRSSYSQNIIIGYKDSLHMEIMDSSLIFYNGNDVIGYIEMSKSSFPLLEAKNALMITDKYMWKQTDTGSLGLYLMG